MRPYVFPSVTLRWLLMCGLLLCGTLPALTSERPAAGKDQKKGSVKKPVPLPALGRPVPRVVVPTSAASAHPATRTAFQHYYDLELDAAVRDFERVYAELPDDPFAANHLLAGVFFRELLRVGALDSSLYSSNAFLSRKEYAVDPVARDRILALAHRSIALADVRLQRDARDVHALYARGVARALLAGYQGIMERAWFAALRTAHAARQDHERVLEISPDYADAKTVVGIHNYIAGSVPWTVKLALSITGMGGDRHRGLALLAEAAASQGVTALDARVALALFLRREQRYHQALPVVQGLIETRPRNFFFALEEGNLLNAAGEGQRAAAAYKNVLTAARQGRFTQPHPELAAYGLGEALRGQRDFRQAAAAYDTARAARSADAELSLRAALAAGEMYDALGDRDHALERYRAVLEAAPPGSPYHAAARKRLREPFRLR